jgi:hypothetical protein
MAGGVTARGNAATRRLARSAISNRAIGRLLGAKTCEACQLFIPLSRRGFRVLVIVDPDVEVEPDPEKLRVVALCSTCLETALAAIQLPSNVR